LTNIGYTYIAAYSGHEALDIYAYFGFIYSFTLHIAGYLWCGIEIFCACIQMQMWDKSVHSGLISLRD